MTKSVGIHEAKTHLSRLIAEVGAGHEVSITNRGSEVARLVPPTPKQKRQFGTDRGKFRVPTDEEWAATDREIEEDFERSLNEPFPE